MKIILAINTLCVNLLTHFVKIKSVRRQQVEKAFKKTDYGLPLHLCGFHSSSQISKPMQVSLVEITASPIGTVVCSVIADIIRGR